MTHRRSLLVACALAATLATPARPDAEPVREVVRAGRYTLKYFGKNVGEEQFVIERTAEGYEIRASVYPKVGNQVPSESVYRLSPDKRLVSATYRELTNGGDRAQYRVENGELIAEAWENGRWVEQRITLEPDAIVTGPHYVTDFFVLDPLKLPVKDRATLPCYAFGFQDWRVSEIELESKREQGRRTKNGVGEPVDANVYRCWIRTSDDTYKTRSWLDEDGVSVRITIAAPIGSVDIRLHPEES